MIDRTEHMAQRISAAVADEAGYWDARLRSPDCSDEDRVNFARWRDAHSDHRTAFEAAQSIVTGFRSYGGCANVRALRDAARRAGTRRPWQGLFSRAAACVGVLALGVVTWTMLPDNVRRVQLRELADIAGTIAEFAWVRANTYETGIGQRSTVTLEDGSRVELNSKTRITVAFTATARNIQLLAGQALFHVAKSSQRPFIVRAADQDITAMGTAFDVKLDATSVRVTLVEGKVRVTKDLGGQTSEGKTIALPSSLASKAPRARQESNAVYLTPGQQFLALVANAPQGTAASAPNIRTIDVSKVTDWRAGRIFLEDLTLEDAVVEMNKYSDVQVRIDDPALAQVRVNGMFRAGDQQAFVTTLREYFPIVVRSEGDQIALSAGR